MKKKILSILILITVAISCALFLGACDSFQKDETIFGHWVTEKQIIQIGDMSSEGKTGFNITINEDGTLTARKYPDIYTGVGGYGTWKEEDGVYKLEIIYEDDDIAHWDATINKIHLTLKQSNKQFGILVTYIMTKSN